MLAKFGPSFLKGACNRTLTSKKQRFYKRVVSKFRADSWYNFPWGIGWYDKNCHVAKICKL